MMFISILELLSCEFGLFFFYVRFCSCHVNNEKKWKNNLGCEPADLSVNIFEVYFLLSLFILLFVNEKKTVIQILT